MRRLASVLLVAALGYAPRLGAMDLVRAEVRADVATAQYGVTGAGVIVAILDRGIDWRNDDFRKLDGTTRIAYILDLTDDSGAAAPGNPYGVGTLYTRSQIDAALAGGPALATRDAVGHGTTSAAIPAGSGRNSPGLKYRGIAPESTILAVKVVAGAPAHDDQPAEATFYDASRLPVAIDFVRDKAAELGMPAVMLLNLGSQGGPTDGTSELARKVDTVVGPCKRGLIFVTGPGDDGGMPNRAGGTVPAGGTVSIGIHKGQPGPLYFDLWYAGADRFDVTIASPTTTYPKYLAPATTYDTRTTSDFFYYQAAPAFVYYGATNGKREIYARLDGPTGSYTITLHGASVTSGRFDATLNFSSFWNETSTNYLTSSVEKVHGSIWDGATAFQNVCPGDYVIRTGYVDVDGIPRTISGQGSPGEIWPGSSTGPTFDGRLGVDVTAPGDSLFTTYNPNSWWATFRFNLVQDGGGLYGRASAVSAAAPIVTGVIALMLQRNPELDAPAVKRILQRSARSDSFTGLTPNVVWGYGKVDALLAVGRSLPNGDADGDGLITPADIFWLINHLQAAGPPPLGFLDPDGDCAPGTGDASSLFASLFTGTP